MFVVAKQIGTRRVFHEIVVKQCGSEPGLFGFGIVAGLLQWVFLTGGWIRLRHDHNGSYRVTEPRFARRNCHADGYDRIVGGSSDWDCNFCGFRNDARYCYCVLRCRHVYDNFVVCWQS